MSIVDPSGAVARELGRRLGVAAAPEGLVPPPAGTERFFTSGSLAGARELMGMLWGREIELAALPLGITAWASYAVVASSIFWIVIALGYITGAAVRWWAIWINTRNPRLTIVVDPDPT